MDLAIRAIRAVTNQPCPWLHTIDMEDTEAPEITTIVVARFENMRFIYLYIFLSLYAKKIFFYTYFKKIIIHRMYNC